MEKHNGKQENNPNVILVLGAGASAFAGYRTFATFPDLIFDDSLRNKDGIPEVRRQTRALLSEIHSALEILGVPPTHDSFLRALDSYVDMWRVLRTDPTLRLRFLNETVRWSEFAYFSENVKDAAEDLTRITISHYSDNKVVKLKSGPEPIFSAARSVYDFIRAMAAMNSNASPSLDIFTTNYDMLIEDLFSEFGSDSVHLTTGFPTVAHKDKHNWNAGLYTQENSVRLFRLHGCVCWFRQQEALVDKVSFCRKNTLEQSWNQVCIVHPGRQDLMRRDPCHTTFQRLYESLKTCKVAVFVGFSFRDDDVAQILLSANAFRKDPLKMVVVGPSLSIPELLDNLQRFKEQSVLPVKVPDTSQVIAKDMRYGNDIQSMHDLTKEIECLI